MVQKIQQLQMNQLKQFIKQQTTELKEIQNGAKQYRLRLKQLSKQSKLQFQEFKSQNQKLVLESDRAQNKFQSEQKPINFFQQLITDFTEEGVQYSNLVCGKSKKQQTKSRRAGQNKLENRKALANNRIIKNTDLFINQLARKYPNQVEKIPMIKGANFKVDIDRQTQNMFLKTIKPIQFQTPDMNNDFESRQLYNDNLRDLDTEIRAKLSSKFQKYVVNVDNILTQVNFTVQALNSTGQLEQTRITGKTIEEAVSNVIQFLRRYGDEGSRFPQNLANLKQELASLSVYYTISPQIIMGKTNTAQIFKEYQNYVIIDPSTEKQCVAQCLAISILYQNSAERPVNLFSYIKLQQTKLAKEHSIKNGATLEQIQSLATRYNLSILTDDEELEVEQKTAYLFVSKGHCMLILKKDARSEYIKASIEHHSLKVQTPMKQYKPTEKQLNKKIGFMTFDLEWLTERQTVNTDCFDQYEYAFGFYSEQTGFISNISDNNNLDNIIDNFQVDFVNTLYTLCEQMPFDEIVLMGLNSMRADFPRVLKSLLNDSRFTKQTISCESGAAQISHTFELPQLNKIVIFTDFLNLQKTSLDSLLKKYNCSVQKGSVNHEIITLENVKEQIVSQNINEYLRGDCEGLYQAYMAFRTQMKEQTNLDVLQLKIFTAASLTQKNYFQNYYKPEETPIYLPTQEHNDYCKKSYQGGLSVVFQQGVFENVSGIDINSSYPEQMRLNIPSGKQYYKLLNYIYNGQPLQYGIYQCVILFQPNLKIPMIAVCENDKLILANLKNYTVYITHERIQLAFKHGYQLYLIDAVVTDTDTNIFQYFIESSYEKRYQTKQQIEILEQKLKVTENEEEKDKIENEIRQLEAICDVQKLNLNSLYGKLGQSDTREISNQITSNKSYILQQLGKGNISSINNLNDYYVMYSGETQQNVKYTNFMVVSYITSRAQEQLLHMLNNLYSMKNFITICYTDTDSVYYNVNKENFDQQIWDEKMNQHLHTSRLGAWKVEKKNQKAVFICSKLYGLQAQNGKETIKAKGVTKYLISNESRRIREGQNEAINFKWMVDLYNNKTSGQTYTHVQTFVQKRLLQDNIHDTLMTTKQINTTIRGINNKSVVNDHTGECIPIRLQGEFTVPKPQEHGSLIFGSFEQIINHFEVESVTDIFNRYTTFQIESSRQYIVIMDNALIAQTIEKYGVNRLHQMHGQYIIPSVDIDCQSDEYFGNNFDFMVQCAAQQLATMLNIEPIEVKTNNRSRQGKYSYHLYVPGKIVNKLSFQSKLSTLKLNEHKLESFEAYQPIQTDDVTVYLNQKTREPSAFIHADLMIYRANGSLRISKSDMYYQPDFMQIQLDTSQQLEKIKARAIKRKESKMGDIQSQSIQKSVEQYLASQNVNGWVFREAIQYKTFTICYFKRTKQAEKKCYICSKQHDNDNTLTVKITCTVKQEFTICCTRKKNEKQQ